MNGSMLGVALSLAARGFRVFPLNEDDLNKDPREIKKPAIKNWDRLATTNPMKIREWWGEHPNRNIGIATGKGIVALDYDMKPGQDGAKALATHDLLELPLDGLGATTPTGGRHAYYKTGVEIRNSASKVA